MLRARWITGLLVAAVSVVGWIFQASAQQLPVNWQQMGANEFASLMRTLQESDTFKLLNGNDEIAVKSRARELFDNIDLSSSDLDYVTVEMLHWPNRHELDAGAMERIRTRLLARQEDWRDRPYEDARAKVRMMIRLKFDEGTIISEGRRWIQAGGTFDQVPAADLRFDLVRRIFSDVEVINGEFSVQWDGFLKPPQTGAYQLLISPINVSAGYSEHPVQQQMTVALNGNTVIASTPEVDGEWGKQSDWVSQSNVINLTADKPVAIKVNYRVKLKNSMPSGTLHALLQWKRPSSNEVEVVPQSSLVLPEGAGNGLKGSYSWQANGQLRTLTRNDLNIDFAWTTPSVLFSTDAISTKQYSDSIWSAVTAPEFLASKAIAGSPLHPFLKDPNDSAPVLTSRQRAAFLDILIQQPALLDSMDPKQIVRFFRAFRIGTQDKAVDVFGTWATRHPDFPCDFSTDRVFNGDQRFAYASLANLTTQQLPNQISTLQSKYLQLSDGGCSQPVAQTLACSELGRERFADWIAFVDAKLANTSLSGDARASWLIARAHAEELNPYGGSHYPYYYGVPAIHPSRAQPYLDRALQAAQDGAVKVQVAREMIGRHAFGRNFAAAKTVLDGLSSSVAGPQQSTLAGLQSRLEGFTALETANQQKQPEQGKQAHIAELKRRRDQASKNGDSSEVTRYDGLIQAVTNAQ